MEGRATLPMYTASISHNVVVVRLYESSLMK